MQYATFGRTGLRVSVVGLGCGGWSQLGQANGATVEESVALVQRALDLGVNLIDTAAGYGTEPIVAQAIQGRRDEVVISTKAAIVKDAAGTLVTAAEFAEAIDAGLRRLKVERIDIFSVHAVPPRELDYVRAEIAPVLIQAQSAGKIRFVGITERFMQDTGHRMLQSALQDDIWDSAMVGLNLLNPSARRTVLPLAGRKQTGVLAMFAVRRALRNAESLRPALAKAAAAGQVEARLVDDPQALRFLEEEAGSLTEAAYRYCRHTAGVDVVLTGTGDVRHLEANIAAMSKPPLSTAAVQRLEEMFGRVDCISGD